MEVRAERNQRHAGEASPPAWVSTGALTEVSRCSFSGQAEPEHEHEQHPGREVRSLRDARRDHQGDERHQPDATSPIDADTRERCADQRQRHQGEREELQSRDSESRRQLKRQPVVEPGRRIPALVRGGPREHVRRGDALCGDHSAEREVPACIRLGDGSKAEGRRAQESEQHRHGRQEASKPGGAGEHAVYDSAGTASVASASSFRPRSSAGSRSSLTTRVPTSRSCSARP
jgi:hypothetical protein